jgi:SAM-dependent methyltransferase
MSDVHTGRTRRLVPETDLPARYQMPWRPAFVAQALEYCQPDMTVLDVGGGEAPTLPSEARPVRCTYIGAAEDPQPSLVGRVDLILSWNVLEHISDMSVALARFHSYLRPGGVLLAQFAGRWAVFAIASRLMPHKLRVQLLWHLIGSPPDKHFPTHYDRCTSRAFDLMLAEWSGHEIVPHYRGAGYFAFSRPLQRAYLAYESMAMRNPELATHYNVRAVR